MNTILYINPIWNEICFQIFITSETITKSLQKNLETAATFPKMLVDIVDEYNISEIWCIVWPGAFTLMRVITLAMNALTYTHNIALKSCHFFDLIKNSNNAILELNPKEYLIRDSFGIRSISKEFILPWIYEWIISSNLSTEGIKYIQYSDSRDTIFSTFRTKDTEVRIVPIYFKPPHITWLKT